MQTTIANSFRGCCVIFSIRSATKPPPPDVSLKIAAAQKSNAIKNHKNHIGPVGVIGSAVQCAQNEDHDGSTAVTR